MDSPSSASSPSDPEQERGDEEKDMSLVEEEEEEEAAGKVEDVSMMDESLNQSQCGANMSMDELLSKPILFDCTPSPSPVTATKEGEMKVSQLTVLGDTPKAFKRPSPPFVSNAYRSKRARSVFGPVLGESGHFSRPLSPFSVAEEAVSIKETVSTNNSSGALVLVDSNANTNFNHHPHPRSHFLSRSQSESAMTIKSAVERINSNPSLVGDGSKDYILPFLSKGKHSDLKEISPDMLITLIEGKYSDHVQNFMIVDCRYPYEFNGGHIKGAINLHTKKQVYERFFGNKEPCKWQVSSAKRQVIVFHCEFSSQRGPEMCRYVRDCDRKMNENEYPNLHYPEMYVLFGGYKAFFENSTVHCDPPMYLPMEHENYIEEYRLYHRMSKTDVMPKTASSKNQGRSLRGTSMKKLNLDNLDHL